MSATPAFIIVDPSLRNFVGHHHAYDSSVAAAAGQAGFAPVVLGHRAAIPAVAEGLRLIPCFRRDIWGRHPWAAPLVRDGVAGLPGRLLDHLLCQRDFADDLRRGLDGIETTPGSMMLAHMVTSKHLGGLAQVLQERAAAGRPLQAVILMRYQAALYDNPIGRHGLRRLEALVAEGLAIRLATDSGRLADNFAALTRLPVETLPIPHTPPEAVAANPPGPLHLASLGGARDEKGIFEILHAIDLLRREPAGLGDLRFTLQANDAAPDVQAALDAFAANLPPEVTLLREPLDGAAYHAALHASDMLLLPYWRSIYEARTSGVFLEALSAGKPVIATRDSWMSDELDIYGAGILVPDRDPVALAAAIRQAARDRGPLMAQAMAARVAVLARHSAAALVRQCVEGPPALAPPRPQVAMLFPWPDLLDRRSGAAMRCGLLLDVVAKHADIHVLHTGFESERRGRITYEGAPPRLPQRLVSRSLGVLARIIGARGQHLPLAWHIERRFDGRFHRQMRRIIGQSDAVLLEYSFWAARAATLARARGAPLILTQHDLLADQVTDSAWLRRLTFQQEVAALRLADHAVTLSAADQACFAAAGAPSQVIVNPVDGARLDAAADPDPRGTLAALGISLPDGPFGLFVGSSHPPNRQAVVELQTLASRCEGLTIVVAGGAAPAGPLGAGFLALGRVSDAALIALYQAASLALIPLLAGTGSSLKTIEAMGFGLPVLGTTLAFRGLPVTGGVDCVVEDRLDAWPGLIAELLDDGPGRAALGGAARVLGRGFDHRQVMPAYLAMLLPALPGMEASTDSGR